MPNDPSADRARSLLRTFRDLVIATHADRGARPGEGLRERKKRLMRQLISDTATAMFLDRGFEGVRVAEIAAACDVSEKTIYNYFPTKESLILDREEHMASELERVLGPGGGHLSPVDAIVGLITRDVSELFEFWDAGNDDEIDITFVRRFGELVESTPALRAAHHEMMDRLVGVAARAMAARADVSPDDPEPMIAAHSLLGLWRVQFHAMQKYSTGEFPPADVCEHVLSDVRRAARLIDTGIWSFGTAVQGRSSREQLKIAGESAAEARKQVMMCIKQARTAWKQAKNEVAHADDSPTRSPTRHRTLAGGGQS